MSDPKQEALIEHLIMQEAISFEGFDPATGETLYTINDKLKDVSPEIYYELEQQFNHHLFKMRQAGPTAFDWKVRL